MTFLAFFCILLLPVAAIAQEQRPAASFLLTGAETEEFLLKASIVSQRELYPGATYSWRINLDDGQRKHDAAVETEDGSTPSQRDYRFNVAAYELDKALDLNLVPPTVERTVKGRTAAVSWFVDDVAMSERDRRRKRIEPPNLESWDKQMQAVRVFDELISNTYRNIDPAFYLSTLWDNLLITHNWRIWIIDHTRTFRTIKRLENPQSLIQCDRTLLSKLRKLNKGVLEQTLGKYLSPEQLHARPSHRRALRPAHHHRSGPAAARTRSGLLSAGRAALAR